MFERLTGANHKELGFHTYIGAKNPYSVALTLGELLLDNTNPKYRPREILNDVFDRLAAYEDSGLSPEEVVKIKKCLNMWVEICKENNVSIVQFKKWAEAEQDGRLVVLPCKVGDTVYEPRKDRGIISEYETTEIIINKYGVSFFRWNLKEGIYSHLGGFPVECLGKTVFLSREAAEKALGVGK
jgi:hypothetical protein